MDVQTVEHHLSAGGIEILVFHLSDGTAVGGIGIVGAKALHVEPVGSPADFFIRGESDLHRGMSAALDDQALRSGHDFRNAGFVVGAQQRGAIGDNEMLAVVLFQRGIVGFPEIDALFFVQQNIGSGILHNSGFDICAGCVGRGVHVGNQADGGKAGVTGDGTVDIAVLIHVGIIDSQGLHFRYQRLAQKLLLFAGRAAGGILVGHGIKGNISQETRAYRFHNNLLIQNAITAAAYCGGCCFCKNYLAALTSSAVS